MKVYSLKTLLVTVFLGGALAVWTLITALRGRGLYWLWFAYILYLIVLGLRASLTQKGYEQDQVRGVRYKRVSRRLFGRFAPAMSYTPALLFLLCCCTVFLRPPVWLYLLLMLGVIAYAGWFSWYIQRELKQEEEAENALP